MLHTPDYEKIETYLGSPQLLIQTLTAQSSVPSTTILPLETPRTPHQRNDEVEIYEVSQTTLQTEIYQLFILVIPISLGYICEWIPTYISNIFLGHLSESELLLAGVGLARMFSNTTALSIIWGLLSGLYTLIPQAVGHEKFQLLSVYIQRAFYVAMICSIPLVILQFFVSDILIAFGEPDNLSTIMSVSCRYFIINVYSNVILTILRRIAQNLQYNIQILMICMVCAAMSVPFNYIFVEVMNMGYVGCVLSVGIITSLNAIIMFVMLIYYGHYQIFKPNRLSKLFHHKPILNYLKLSVPGIFSNSFEWWYYEITILFAGYIAYKTNQTSVALSSAVILHNVFMIIELIGVGIGRSLSIQIGKYIGSNNQKYAKIAMKAGVIVSLLISLIVMIILSIFRRKIPMLFTNSTIVIDITSNVMWIAVISAFFIITNHSISGIYHAIGKQKISAWIIFVSYFVIGLPIMLVLLFVFDFKESLLYGTMIIFAMICIGNFIATLIMQQYLSCFINWDNVMEDAQSRLQETLTKTANLLQPNYGSVSISRTIYIK